MIQITNNGLSRSGIGQDGQPFTVWMADFAAFSALGLIMSAQTQAATDNKTAQKQYLDAVAQYGAAQNTGHMQGVVIPHKPLMQVVPDYLGSDGQPIIQSVEFVPALPDVPAPPVTAPNAGIVNVAAHEGLSPFESAVVGTLTAIAKKLGV